MTKQEILEEAIQKAIDGGWLPYFAQFDKNMTKDTITVRYTEGTSSVNFDYQMKGHVWGVGGYDLEPFSIIFNHDFAKALFGVEKEWNVADRNEEDGTGFSGYVIPYWQGMLQQMVIADDPIQYLGDNL